MPSWCYRFQSSILAVEMLARSFLKDRYEVTGNITMRPHGRIDKAQEKTSPYRSVVLKTVQLKEPAAEHLKKEFKVLNSLSHPHVVRVYDFGIDEKEGLAFVAEEFLEGQPAPHTQIPEATFIEWLGMLAQALHYLHRHHIYHGDIKPENVIVSQEGAVTLVDFGFAQRFGEANPVDHKVHTVKGTLNYIAPELFGKGRYSAASDLYALGVMLYEWATGHLPFEESVAAQLIPTILWKPPPSPLKFNEDLSPVLSDLILRLLQKNPLDRPSRANDLIRELNARLNLDLPLEEEHASTSWWQVAGTIGREELLNDVTGVSLVHGPAGIGKSAFLTALYAELQLKGHHPEKLIVKDIQSRPSFESLFPKGLPEVLLVDDFDLLPTSVQLEMIKKGVKNPPLLWVWTASAYEDSLFPQELGIPYDLPPLNLNQERQLIESCFNIQKIEKSFVDSLHALTQGRPQFTLKALDILLQEAIDSREPLALQLAHLSLKDFLQADDLTGIRSKHPLMLKKSRRGFMDQVKKQLNRSPQDEECRQLLVQLLSEEGDYQAVLNVITFDQDPLTYINICNRLGRFEEALNYCQTLKTQAKSTDPSIAQLNQEGTAYFFLGKMQEATEAFKQAEKLARKEQAWDKLVVCLNNLANVMTHETNMMDAIFLYNQSLKLAQKLKDPYSEGRAYANLGHLYHVMEDYRHALEYYYAGANLYRQIGFLGEMAQIKMNLGTLYMEIGAIPQAEEAILSSLQLAQERHLAHQVAYSYYAYGELMRRRQLLAAAKIYYQKAQRGFLDLNISEGQNLVLIGLNRLALTQKNWALARTLLNKLEQTDLTERLLAQYKFLLAQFTLAQQGSLKEVEKPLLEALRIYEDQSQDDHQILVMAFLKMIYERFHEPQLAQNLRQKIDHLLTKAPERIPEEYWKDYKSLLPG
jgi:tetratricopeptide (TPR) repeat protein